MKKLLLYALKTLHNLTNHIPTAEEEAKTILNYMLFIKGDVKRTLSVYDALENQLAVNMVEEKRKAIEVVRNIDFHYELDECFTFKD
jgi:hypothetical protein